MIILFSSRSKPLFCGTKNIYVKVQVWFGQDVEYSYYNNFYDAFFITIWSLYSVVCYASEMLDFFFCWKAFEDATCISLVVSMVAAIFGPVLFIFQQWAVLLDSCDRAERSRSYHTHTAVKASYTEPLPQRCQDEADANPLRIDPCCHVLTCVIQDRWQDESLPTVNPYNLYVFGSVNFSHQTEMETIKNLVQISLNDSDSAYNSVSTYMFG